MSGDTLRAPAHGKCETVEIRHDGEDRFIGDIVADKNRAAPAKGFVSHQFANTGCLGKAGMLDFADAFSGQHFDRRIGQIGPDQGHRLVDRLLRVRRQPIVQRQRIALVFEQNARTELGNGGKPALQFLESD